MSKSETNVNNFEYICSDGICCNTSENDGITPVLTEKISEESDPSSNDGYIHEDEEKDDEIIHNDVSPDVSPDVSTATEHHPWGISNILSSFWLGKQYDVNIDLSVTQPNDLLKSTTRLSPAEVSNDSDSESEKELGDNNIESTDSESEKEVIDNNIESTDSESEKEVGDNNIESTDSESEKELGDNKGTSKEKIKEVDYNEEGCFVIVTDSQPLFYMNNIESARIKMRELANRLSGGYTDYNVYIEQQTPDEIHVVGNYRYYVISHTRILDRLRVQKVPRFTDESCVVDSVANILNSSYKVW